MARQRKNTVEYFPHFCHGGRTIFILEARFGNDGYAFWFKLLEILGNTDGHAYDCQSVSNWAFLLATTHVDEQRANDIIGVLIDLGKIDRGLWEARRVIWVQNFVNNLTELYRKRIEDLPQRPDVSVAETSSKPINRARNEQLNAQSGADSTSEEVIQKQKSPKGKESKEEKSKYPYQGICESWNRICQALPQVQKLSDKRRQQIKSRCEEWATRTEFCTVEPCERTPEAWLAEAERLFKRIAASSFCQGKNNRGWQATFDWFFGSSEPTNKVREGKYDDRKPINGAQGSQMTLGVGEFIDGSGRRTYGSGRATIPNDAAPRPSERHQWSAETKTWIII